MSHPNNYFVVIKKIKNFPKNLVSLWLISWGFVGVSPSQTSYIDVHTNGEKQNRNSVVTMINNFAMT